MADMKMLLTSSGISNPSIENALVGLLGKPIAESNALLIMSGMHPFPVATRLVDLVQGRASNRLTEIGWKSLGLLELTAMPTIRRESWVPALEEADALLVYGGHVAYMAHFMRAVGMDKLLPQLDNLVYVGVSAGSIVTTPYNCDAESNRESLPDDTAIATDHDGGLGLVDFTTWVHVGNPNPIFEDHTLENIEKWARDVTVPTYALDDASAIVVDGDKVTVVSEGQWQVFPPGR
jgi:dipeptidase E